MGQKSALYYYEVFLDYLAFSPNILEDLKSIPKEMYLNKEFLIFLKYEFDNAATTHYYPSEVYDNLMCFLNKIYKQLDLEDEELDKLYDQVLISFTNAMQNTSNNYYYDEYQLKYSTVEDLKNLRYISKEKLIESIRYDFYVLNSFFLPKEEYEKILSNKLDNDNYLLSLKKILKEAPEIFIDEDKEARALQVLVNIYKEKEKNNEEVTEVNKQMYKLMHILKTCKNGYYNEEEFMQMYYYTILKLKIINNSKNDNLVNERLLYAAYSLILDENSYYNEEEKEILSEILFQNSCTKREELKNDKEQLKEFLIVHNEALSKLNTRKPNNVGIVEYEISNIYEVKNIIGKTIAYNNPNKREQIKKEVIDSILMDQQLMNYYIFNTDLNIKDKRLISISIKKLYRFIPSIFEDNSIYSKTINLLEQNKDHKTLRLIKRYNNHIYE